MKSDISRRTFDSSNNFSRVLMQQGRVQLDADWNEQTDILLYYLRALAQDLIGDHGGPGPAGCCGFGVGFPTDGSPGITLTPGRYYVNGLLCETSGPNYFDQPSYPLFKDGNNPDKLPPVPYLVYLDVWERAISFLDVPQIREVALGGPDTAMRTKVLWQVKAMPAVDDEGNALSNVTCETIDSSDNKLRWPPSTEPRGMLKVRARLRGNNADPCLISPESQYRGAENQLYRVEIHAGGKIATSTPVSSTDIGTGATFKWSRDNGGTVALWIPPDNDDGDGGNVVTAAPVRSTGGGFAAGQWVEITSDVQELRGELGDFVQLIKAEGDKLTFGNPPVPPPVSQNLPNRKIRRWDQTANTNTKLVGGAVQIVEGMGDNGWIALENGIEIQFQQPSSPNDPLNVYRPGDYWIFAARVATGDVEWPKDPTNPAQPLPRGPDGVEHFYAPLALVATNPPITDLRHQFGPIGKCVSLNQEQPRDPVVANPPPHIAPGPIDVPPPRNITNL